MCEEVGLREGLQGLVALLPLHVTGLQVTVGEGTKGGRVVAEKGGPGARKETVACVGIGR